MKSKDLWDMRDLPLPTRERDESSAINQSIKSRSSASSLAEWGDNSDFWGEWNSEFKGAREITPQINTPNAKVELASEQLNEDQDLHFEPWASQLAFHERRLEKEGTVDYGVPFKRQELLGEKTKEFAKVLQATFRKHIEVFNNSRKAPAHAIHIYRVSKTDEDFLIYRNGVKLIVSGQRAGRITLSFNQFIAPLAQADKHAHVELEAVWGAFDQLHWMYKGERVELNDVVRYFLSELAYQSFR